MSAAESGDTKTGIRPQRTVPDPLLLPQSPTGDPPEVKPSSAELRSPRSLRMMLAGPLAMILVHDEEELDPAEESTEVFMREFGEMPPPDEEQEVRRGPCPRWGGW